MLYQIGPLTLDTFPASISKAKWKVSADYAKHPLLNRRQGYESEGPGDEVLDLSGEILPFHIGGLGAVALAQHLCLAQEPQFVMRGDGLVLGWFVLMECEEEHGGQGGLIAPNGVGYVVGYSLKLERVDDPGPASGAGLIASILSLFG